MNSQDIREKFLKYFEQQGHKIIPSASLVPSETDPTALFTTAGMHPLVPFLMGDIHPAGKRLVNLQRCIRTGDIDEVGDPTHLTFFEMMGYWSLGDYWKSDAIKYIYNFLTQELNLDPKSFAATCFEGDKEKGIAKDTEAYEVWRSLGIPEERIAYLGYEDNWWGPASKTGPCGPDSELFVWVGEGEAPAGFDPENKGWMELCNDVFMQYNKTADGKFEPLSQKNVDFGMGFERLVSYLEKKKSVYETDLFATVLDVLVEKLSLSRDKDMEYLRIIADHLKAASFMAYEGIIPSNKDQGYVMRRLVRRALLHSQWQEGDFSWIKDVIEALAQIYPILNNSKDSIGETILTEVKKFQRTLANGKKMIEKLDELNAKTVFDLYQSYGFPLELSKEYAALKNIKISSEDLNKEIERHRELSRTASAGMFKGGLADNKEETTKLHTSAHLLLAALRKVLGDHVTQKGANITEERLRFDFSHPEKMTPDQISEVELLVNQFIASKAEVTVEELDIAEAKKAGATGVFDDRYGAKVKVYTITNTSTGEVISKEICGGPHVKNTGELGQFKIKKEESSSSGVRRIKAILE